VLLYSGAIKLARPYEFLHAVFQYRIFGGTGATIFTATLPAVELTLGLALVAGVCAAGAALLSALLFAAFSIAQGVTLIRGIVADCGCFGAGETIGPWTVVRALTLLAVAATCLACEEGQGADAQASLEPPRGGLAVAAERGLSRTRLM
jgi:hypothetical protein